MMTLKSAVLFIGTFTISSAFSAQLNHELVTGYKPQTENSSTLALKNIDNLLVKLNGHLPPGYFGPCTPYPMCVIYPDGPTPPPESGDTGQPDNK